MSDMLAEVAMRHDFAELVELVWPPPDGVAELAAALADGASPVVVERDEVRTPLPGPLDALLRSAVEHSAEGRAVALLATGEVLSLGEAAAEMEQEEWLVRYLIRGGLLEDYVVGDEHHIAADSIRRCRERGAIARTVGLDFTEGRVTGWDDETSEQTWTSAIAVVEPGDVDKDLLTRLSDANSPTSIQVAGLRGKPLPTSVQTLLRAAAQELAAGKTIVVAAVMLLDDEIELTIYTASSHERILELIAEGMLDDFPFRNEHHVASGSVMAFYRHQREVDRLAREQASDGQGS